ncbi:CYTH and CHAD domain-containing protein [Methylobacterium oryzihabitans]|uniref:CYTH and CHAD domain-containing protein n=1 Tax=Methylobacterium oryzihabitans TaxID=2499852 RepID=A0A437P5A0_9HYPH|nr:CYTH and CHAD domain-containing protein [Methylobacterium oryzihabitans]RVU17455.1 CYTH and CHAD domain-containing protein [Methylobacterium oryzihabitans]
MSEPRETELKLEIEGSDLAALKSHPALGDGDWTARRLRSVYFDTEDDALRGAGYALRVRHDGDGYVQTLKGPGASAAGLFDRPEWEWTVPGPDPDLGRLGDTPAGDLVGKAGVAPMFAVEVERATRVVAHGEARIEVALDQGRAALLDGGGRYAPVNEIELELKQGSPADLFGLAREVAASVPLRLGVLTKAERGDALRRERLGAFSKAETLHLDPEASAGAAFQAIAHACLRHMRINEDALLAHREPEALHQLRVSLRRLRSAVSLFGDLVADSRTPDLVATLKRLSEPFGDTRNLDVFLAKTLPAERERRPDEPGLLALEKHLEAERLKAYDGVVATLTSAEWRGFVLDLMTWIETGAWLSRPAAATPARAFATGVLEKRRRQVKTRGRDLDELEPEARHRVRIAAKKLRYGSEFFGSLYTGKKAAKRHKAFVAALSDLQDHLGDLNDIATAHTLAADLPPQVGAPASALFAAGLTAADNETRSAKLLKQAAGAHEALVEVRPFWR